MLSFLTRRFLFIILVSLLIIFFTQLGMRMISNSSTASPNFDIAQQTTFARRDTRAYINAAISGELGYVSDGYEQVPIKDILTQSYINSMGLLLASLTVATIGGFLIGVFLALTRHRRFILPALTFTLLGISIPSFFAAILLERGEILYLRTFGHRLVSISGFGWDLEHMLLPLLVLAARPIAYITRTSYISLSRIMDQDYIRTAFAKGLSRNLTVSQHALRNLAIPVLTAIGVSLRFSLASLPIVELFFRWPGIGSQLLRAIDARQTYLVVTLSLVLGLTFLIFNLLLDISYRFLDPRIREMS
jgi:peptide/nickel transport system permease protein